MTELSVVPSFDLNNLSTCKQDLANPKPKNVLQLVEVITAESKANPDPGNLPVTTGWNDITPEIALNLLKRNRPGANRKLDPQTVFYYASQMARGQWKATGQPMLLDGGGHLVDAQHRLYAVLISGVTIRSFVVTEIEPIPGLFAYIDNSRSRTAATALQTMGLNGVSPLIAKVIKIGEEIRAGVYNPANKTKLARMSPADYIDLVNSYPNVTKAARSASSDWEGAVTALGDRKVVGDRKDIVAYLGMRIIDEYGEDRAYEFFNEIMDGPEDREADDPILALLKLAEKDASAKKPMKKHHMLGAMIKVFNSWHSGKSLGKRWIMLVNEDFPIFAVGDEPQVEAEAAE